MINPSNLVAKTISIVPSLHMGGINLIVTWTIKGQTAIVDSVGNRTFSTQQITTKASVRKTEQDPQEKQIPGTGITAIALEGRTEGTLDHRINYKTEATAQWVDSASGIIQTGHLKLIEIIPDRFPAISQKMGTFIKCELLVKSNF
jgi:hypothetical protein